MRLSVRGAWTLGVAALLLLGACNDPKELEAKYVAHGKSLYESGDLVKAALEFKNALQINPRDLEAQLYMARIAEKNQQLDVAAATYQKVADADPKNFEANQKAGQYSLLSGDPDQASRYARQLIEMAPTKPDGHTMLGAALLMQNKLPEAEKEANAALALDAQNVDALVVLAGKQTRDNQPDLALATVERGLQAKPDNADLLLVKLKLMFDQKRAPEVEATLRKLHELDPKNPNYVIDLANQIAAAGRVAEADSIFKQALDLNKDSDPLIAAYAGFLVNKRSLDEAITQVKELADQTKQSPKYVLLLEQLYLKAGKLEPAEALMNDLQQNGTVANDRLRAKVELARIAAMKGDKQGPLDTLNSVIAADAGNEPALLLRGAIMLNEAKYDNAIADARTVLHQNINSLGGLTLLAKAYTATGETDLAIGTLRSVLRITPTDIDARLQLASLLAAKSPDDALDNLDAVIALRPDAKELQVQKAEYLIRTGSPDKAELIAQELVKDPKFKGLGHRILGEAALARADFATSITELNAAQAEGIPFDNVAPMLIAAYVRAGKPDQANAALTERIAKDPSDTHSITLLAALRVQQGKLDEAEQMLRQAIAAKPKDSEPYLALARLLNQQNRPQDVVKVSADAAQAFPDDRNVAIFAAVALDTAGDFDSARASYERILAKWPNDLIAANNLAALIADVWSSDRGLLDRARQLAEKFRTSTDPVLLDTLGWVLVRQGNYDDGAILLAKATSLATDNQQMQFHYAVALNAKGLTAKAKDAFSKSLAGNPNYRGLDESKKLLASLK